jgi:hypothetical protein
MRVPATVWKPADMALRYVVEGRRDPVTPETGIYVHKPDEAGPSYYAVTVVSQGKEITEITNQNSLETAIAETVTQGVPVLQRIVKQECFQYITNPMLHYYVMSWPFHLSWPSRLL